MIVSIKVGERILVLVDRDEAAEVIQANPHILVQYLGQKRIKKDLTFGGKQKRLLLIVTPIWYMAQEIMKKMPFLPK